MKDQLDHVRANLMLSLIVFMATRNSGNSVSMVLPPEDDGTTESTTAEASMRKEVRRAVLSDQTFYHDLKQLIPIVSDDGEGEYGAFKAIKSVCHSYRKGLERMSKKLEDTLAAQNQGLVLLSSKMDSLLRVMNTETLSPRKVIDSLYYAQMDDRRYRISRAHSKTFQWIFRHKSDNGLLWDDFLGWLSSPHEHNIYWVRGKAGSGKSTLMRELDEKVSEQKSLADWVQEAEFLKASSYLWNAGSVVQKSLSGLLLSIVYQLFQQRADLIESTVSSYRWQSALQGAQMMKWTDTELQEALKSFASKACPEAKLLLLVDGLDEYDGTDEQRMDMISLFKELTAIEGVKACVSSRPWVIYKDAFKSCPQLRLEELTKGDISTYVHDQLLGNELFRAQQRRHPKLLTYISDEIIQKASGVFLWVRLVVRELLKRVRDGGWASELINQLDEIPPDLDDYFKRMMESIEPRYRQDASIFLQIALCEMDFTLDQTNPNAPLTAGPDLLTLHLQYLHEEEAPEFATSSDFRPLSYDQDDEISSWLEILDRRLTSRCMGLLETSKPLPGRNRWESRVDFLHRTVKDFLCTSEAQRVLHKYTIEPYDAHMYRCNVLVADVMSLGQFEVTSREIVRVRLLNMACFLSQIQNRPNNDESAFALYDKLVVFLESVLQEAEFWSASESVETKFDEIMRELKSDWRVWQDLPIKLARKIGWQRYVDSRLSARREQVEDLIDNVDALTVGTTILSTAVPSDAFFSARSGMSEQHPWH
jgi:NACHT domain